MQGIFANHIERLKLAFLHGIEHGAQVQTTLRRYLDLPFFLEFRAKLVVFHMLKSGEAVGQGAHIPASLNVILPSQRIYPGTITSHMPGQKREIDQGEDVVDSVVMLCNSQGPADLGAIGLSIGMSETSYHFCAHARDLLRILEGIRLNGFAISLETRGSV